MVDRGEGQPKKDDSVKDFREGTFVPGRVEPSTKPEGYYWKIIKGLDPTKPPGTISGYELTRIVPTPQGEVALPPEKEGLRGSLIEQEHFMDMVESDENTPTSTKAPAREEPGQSDTTSGPTESPGSYIRGNYTADLDAEAQEREDELREEAVRRAMQPPPKMPQEKPPSET